MPYLGRHEQLKDYPTPGITWRRHQLQTTDGTNLVLCRAQKEAIIARKRRIKIVYLQGNASSTPPRLPPLTKILLEMSRTIRDAEIDVIALPYRGYWESSGRPSESGLLQDVKESLASIVESEDGPIELVIWGHSIGASLAVLTLPHLDYVLKKDENVKIILETPFDSISSVLKALYPQRWLPYRYLTPFLRTRLDLDRAMSMFTSNLAHKQKIALAELPVLVVKAEKDEIVPAKVSDRVTAVLQKHKIGQVTEAVVRGGLHQDCLFKLEMHRLVIDFIKSESNKIVDTSPKERGEKVEGM